WLRRHKGPVGVAAAGCALAVTVAVAWALVAAAVERAEKQERVAAEMDRLRSVADIQHAEADRQRVRAEDQKALARRYLYSSRMNMAGIAWHEAQIAHMQELLDQERPGATDQEDLRGFEWYYLWRLRYSHQRTIKAHPRGAQAVALSADGTRLASGSANYTHLDMPGEVKVWDVASGRELFCFRRFGSHVVAVAFSPDGNRLATGCGKDPRLRLWNLTTGQEETTIPASAPHVVSVAFSPDGRRLASSSGAKVSIWDPTSRRELLTLDAHAVGVGRVAFSPDGQRLAGALGDGTVKIWDAVGGREVRVLAGHKGGV